MAAAPRFPIRDGCALAFAMFFPLAMALIYFVVLSDPAGRTNPLFMTAFGTGKFVQFIFPALYVWWFEREEIGLPRPTWRGIPLGVGFALIVAIAMYVLFFAYVQSIPTVAERTPGMINNRLKQFGLDSPLGFLVISFYVCVPHALGEEYYWRWFVFGWLRRYVPLPIAIVVPSVGFMLHHVVILAVYFPGRFWTLALPFSLCVAFGGGVWSWLYHRSGSLYAPWVSHALIDAAIMGLGYWMLRGYWV